MTITVLLECINCDEKKNISDEIYTCDSCVEKEKEEQFNQSGNSLLDEIFKSGSNELDGSTLCGFKNEKDKELFMQGMRLGLDHAAFIIADYFEIIQEWEEFHEKFMKLKIEVKFEEGEKLQ